MYRNWAIVYKSVDHDFLSLIILRVTPQESY